MINPCRILLVTEPEDFETIQIAKYAVQRLAGSNIFQIYSEDPQQIYPQNQEKPTAAIILPFERNTVKKIKIDYIMSIGQNQTMLKSLRYNKESGNAPIISISNGNQPIMSSYSFCDIDEVLNNFIRSVRKKEVKIDKMMRLQLFQNGQSKPKKFLTNFSSELEIHRDMKASVLKLNIYLRTEGKQFYLLTPMWGDGVIISTPFGSMGRSMKQNGPILHHKIESIQIVPICPLSLKFRPIVLPKDSQILIKICEDSRSVGEVFADGQLIHSLGANEQIQVHRDQSSCTQVVKNLVSYCEEISWIFKLQEVLSWGEHYHPYKGSPQNSQSSLRKKESITLVRPQEDPLQQIEQQANESKQSKKQISCKGVEVQKLIEE